MLFVDGGLGLLILALWLFCVFDVLTTAESDCRNLPKLAWVGIVLIFFDLGAIAWLVAGRPWGARSTGMPYKGNTGRPVSRFPEYDRPGRFAATSPDDDEQFLAEVKARAERQRADYRRAQQARQQAEDEALLRRDPPAEQL